MTGNYSFSMWRKPSDFIIPYQVMTGNYSRDSVAALNAAIIPYQVMTGNYSTARRVDQSARSYHTK